MNTARYKENSDKYIDMKQNGLQPVVVKTADHILENSIVLE